MEIKKAISVLKNSHFWDYADGAPEDMTAEFCDAVDAAIMALNCVCEVSDAISRIGKGDESAETQRDVVEFVSYDGRFPNNSIPSQASFILASWNNGECEPVLRRFSSLASALSTIHDEIDEIANEQYMTQEEKEECVIQDTWNSVFLEGFDGKTYYWWVVDEASVEDRG